MSKALKHRKLESQMSEPFAKVNGYRWQGLKDCQLDLMKEHSYTEEQALDECVKIYSRLKSGQPFHSEGHRQPFPAHGTAILKEYRELKKSLKRRKTRQEIDHMLKPYTPKEKPVTEPKWKMPSHKKVVQNIVRARQRKAQRALAKKGSPLATRGKVFDVALAEVRKLVDENAWKHGWTPNQKKQVLQEIEGPYMNKVVDNVFARRKKVGGRR